MIEFFAIGNKDCLILSLGDSVITTVGPVPPDLARTTIADQGIHVSESIENIPSGYRAKETYRFLSDDEIEETFEIAEPNKEFAVYSKVKLVRQK